MRSQQRALSGVLRAIARAAGLQPVLDEVVEAATRLCDGDHGQLYLARGDSFVVLSASGGAGAAMEYSVAHPHARDRTSVIGRVALTREPVQIPDVLADPEYSYGALQIVGYRALLGVPDPARRGADRCTRRRSRSAWSLRGSPCRARQDIRRPGRDRDRERAGIRSDRAAAHGAFSVCLASGRRADLLARRRAAARGPPRVYLLSVLRPARLHRVHRDRRTRGTLRGAAGISRADRRVACDVQWNARALCWRRSDDLLQRPGRRHRSRAAGDSVSRSLHRNASASSPAVG